MILSAEEIKLAYAVAIEEKEYYLDQIEKDNRGEAFEEYEVNDFIALSEIIIPTIEKGLKENELDTYDFQKPRIFIMALEAYVASHLADLTPYNYGLLVKMKLTIEDELIREYENNIKPEDWHRYEEHVLEARERVTGLIRYWNKKRKKGEQIILLILKAPGFFSD